MEQIIEKLQAEIDKYEKINEKLMETQIPPWTEIEQNRGYINGLRCAIQQIRNEVQNDED